VRELLGPLAARARSRGARLVLGFDEGPPAGLAHEVLLDPTPLTGGAEEPVTAAQAEKAVRRLAEREAAAARLQDEEGARFFGAPPLPRCTAARLRVRLAVARSSGSDRELAAVRRLADAADAALTHFERAVHHRVARCHDARAELRVHQARAARYFGVEDRELAELHSPAMHALWTQPIDLDRAQQLVRRYVREVRRRIDEEGGHGPL